MTKLAYAREWKDAGEGFYYLHTEGDLIYKSDIDDPNSDFIKKIWAVDTHNRANAYRILIEGAALGAKKSRIEELRKTWKITNPDCFTFAALSHILLCPEEGGFQAKLLKQDILVEGPQGFQGVMGFQGPRGFSSAPRGPNMNNVQVWGSVAAPGGSDLIGRGPDAFWALVDLYRKTAFAFP